MHLRPWEREEVSSKKTTAFKIERQNYREWTHMMKYRKLHQISGNTLREEKIRSDNTMA